LLEITVYTFNELRPTVPSWIPSSTDASESASATKNSRLSLNCLAKLTTYFSTEH